ncbi:hypothetical protein D6779_09610, partial [Candidatus Parcubacteria bacterium]
KNRPKNPTFPEKLIYLYKNIYKTRRKLLFWKIYDDMRADFWGNYKKLHGGLMSKKITKLVGDSYMFLGTPIES